MYKDHTTSYSAGIVMRNIIYVHGYVRMLSVSGRPTDLVRNAIDFYQRRRAEALCRMIYRIVCKVAQQPNGNDIIAEFPSQTALCRSSSQDFDVADIGDN